MDGVAPLYGGAPSQAAVSHRAYGRIDDELCNASVTAHQVVLVIVLYSSVLGGPSVPLCLLHAVDGDAPETF